MADQNSTEQTSSEETSSAQTSSAHAIPEPVNGDLNKADSGGTALPLESQPSEEAPDPQAAAQAAHSEPREGRRERFRGPGGGREGSREGSRETGGYRIRLSDNEQRAAQLVQESFQLRTPVAALGFSIRTVAQLLEEGKLDALVAQHRAQAGARPEANREASSVRRLESRGEGRGIVRTLGGREQGRSDGRSEGRSDGRQQGRDERRGGRPDPFARPSRPQPAPVDDTPLVEVAPLIDPSLLDPAVLDGIPPSDGPLPVTIEPTSSPTGEAAEEPAADPSTDPAQP